MSGKPNLIFHRGGQMEQIFQLEVVVETLQYDLVIFKIHFGKLTLKVCIAWMPHSSATTCWINFQHRLVLGKLESAASISTSHAREPF